MLTQDAHHHQDGEQKHCDGPQQETRGGVWGERKGLIMAHPHRPFPLPTPSPDTEKLGLSPAFVFWSFPDAPSPNTWKSLLWFHFAILQTYLLNRG